MKGIRTIVKATRSQVPRISTITLKILAMDIKNYLLLFLSDLVKNVTCFFPKVDI